MKILVLSHEYPPIGGGGANACRYLAREFAKEGDEVTVVTVDFPALPREEAPEGVRIFRLPAKRSSAEHSSFPEMLDYLRRAIPFSEKLLRQEHFDICLANFGIPGGAAAYVLKKKYGLPYGIRFGGGDVPGFQKRFAFVYPLLGPFIRRIWDEAGFRVANSEGLKQMALRFYDRAPFTVVPNGVDPVEFCPESGLPLSGETGDKNCVKLLFVSRLIERKGLQHVLRALPQLRDAEEKPVRLTVVGDGPYRETLEQLAAEQGVQELVRFVGAKAHGELPAVYRTADLFVLPSEKEGMPNVVLEAMACGLPVLMTPCPGAEELMDGNGIVAEVGELPERLAELVKDDALRERMGRRSRQLVEERFTWEKTARKYGEMMEKLV